MAQVENNRSTGESLVFDSQGGIASLHSNERADIALELLRAELNESDVQQVADLISYMRK